MLRLLEPDKSNRYQDERPVLRYCCLAVAATQLLALRRRSEKRAHVDTSFLHRLMPPVLPIPHPHVRCTIITSCVMPNLSSTNKNRNDLPSLWHTSPLHELAQDELMAYTG